MLLKLNSVNKKAGDHDFKSHLSHESHLGDFRLVTQSHLTGLFLWGKQEAEGVFTANKQTNK